MVPLAQWLSGLDPAALSELLERRPEVLAGAPPRTIDELAQRLQHQDSVVHALRRLTLPSLQAVEALVALGSTATRQGLRELLVDTDSQDDRLVDATIDDLCAVALAWPAGADRLGWASGTASIFPHPLGLSPPLRTLLAAVNADTIKRILLTIDRTAVTGRRAELEDTLVSRLGDHVAVSGLLAGAPDPVRQTLLDWAAAGDPATANDLPYPRQHQLLQERKAAADWAAPRGLLIDSGWGFSWSMPAEVALTLRGPAFKAPFSPIRPEPTVSVISSRVVQQATAAAAAEFAQQAAAVLDTIQRTPYPLAKSGGVALKDLARLAKAAAVEPMSARICLELAWVVGLLDQAGGRLQVSSAFAPWRSAEPARRLASLIEAWWQLPFPPSAAEDGTGKQARPLSRPWGAHGGEYGRGALLAFLADLPPDRATDLAAITPALEWNRPVLAMRASDEASTVVDAWNEATTMGVIAAGALTAVGHAVLSGDSAELVSLLTDLLPASSDRASFGSDLTAMVVGSPSARVSRLLDQAADRESRGAAVTWRFGRESVRRALDEGADAEALVAELTAIASAELPQPVSYLIRDVARRHGELRLSEARTLIRSEDVARLAEVAADRSLRRLGLRLLAPTVLTSQADEQETMTALRKAGYSPMPEAAATKPPERGGSASAPSAQAMQRRAWATERELLTEPEPETEPIRPALRLATSAASLARQLLATASTASTTGTRAAASPIELDLAALNRSLSSDELRQLAYAIESGQPVTVGYESSSGARTRRTVSEAQLSGTSLLAWCHLRDAERFFTVSRILFVTAAG